MIYICGLLLCLGAMRTSGNDVGLIVNKEFDSSASYSYWPSLHNAASVMRIRKREVEQVGANEGGGGVETAPISGQTAGSDVPIVPAKPTIPKPNDSVQKDVSETISTTNNTLNQKQVINTIKVSENKTTIVNATSPVPTQTTVNTTKQNETPTDTIDLSGPGVVKRGVIVFGGFALLAVAYFVFYRRKGGKNEVNNSHSTIDANQFRYGVLQSDDRRDNMELSRVPLTMESDDDDEDDLEIFDLEQKKKSMSYVNLQMNDEEVVKGMRDSGSEDRDNLLLDIEDVNTDTLINWSNNESKSIL